MPFDQNLPISLVTTILLCFCEFSFFRFHFWVESYDVCFVCVSISHLQIRLKALTGRQAGGPQEAGVNDVPVADWFSAFSVDNIWFCLNLTFLKPPANQCVFLMEIFFLSYVDETMYLLWNLSFFKLVPPNTKFFSSLKPWTENASTNQYACHFMARDDTPCTILSQKCIL